MCNQDVVDEAVALIKSKSVEGMKTAMALKEKYTQIGNNLLTGFTLWLGTANMSNESHYAFGTDKLNELLTFQDMIGRIISEYTSAIYLRCGMNAYGVYQINTDETCPADDRYVRINELVHKHKLREDNFNRSFNIDINKALEQYVIKVKSIERVWVSDNPPH